MEIPRIPDIPTVDTMPLHWNPLTSINKDSQQHTFQGVRNGTSIAVIYRSYKDRWVTSDLVIEGVRYTVHIITLSSTTPGESDYQEAYRIKLARIYHIIIIVEEI